MSVQFWTCFTFSNSSAERRHARKNHRRGLRHAVPFDPVVLVFWAICPLSRLVRRRGWPCAGYSGLVNPGSGVFVCWNKIPTHECRHSLSRLLGRAAVMVTRYERIERMVPRRVTILIIIGAVKIKVIVSSFGDSRRIKRLSSC